MRAAQHLYCNNEWNAPLESLENAQIVLAFGNKEVLANSSITQDLNNAYPNADIIGCSTAGEIFDDQVYDDSLSVTAIEFKNTNTAVVAKTIESDDVYELAQSLIEKLPLTDLKYLLVLSDGQVVNGSKLAEALTELLPNDVIITGGLAGDGTNFTETYTRCNASVSDKQVVLCGFYGDAIQINHGCHGGWLPFGPKRLITKSDGNLLYTLDDKPALDIYKTYLGKYAEELPSSALLFPLQIIDEELTRTILNIGEDDRSMTFAGDLPEGQQVQLMRANSANLVDGAKKAATDANSDDVNLGNSENGIALLISCVGRRLAMKTRTEEELSIVRDILSDRWKMAGFYSYGELSPKAKGEPCHLHNQTMTITTFYESL